VSFVDDLLTQAEHLTDWDETRPKQANLRRSVSTAYYALFHQLTDASASFLVSGSGPGRDALRKALRRAFAHTDMMKLSKSFAGRAPPNAWKSAAGSISNDLKFVADAFVEIQQARHEADYDHTRKWTKQQAREVVMRARAAIDAWERVKGGQDACAYLVALLTNKLSKGPS